MARILIVDDDQGFIDSTTKILEGAGFEVITATSPDEGSSQAESGKPDLIMLDVSLKSPEDGLVMGKNLGTKGITTPIIILENVTKAAAFSTDTTGMAIEAYAEKPLDADKIVNKIKAIISRD